ncbi:hypothetical protein G4B88_027487 [Cannabis sativa]|uniref:Uncharacterized protein n=1 Tax=Cannabis sativa TaxID=3483 RepID=A0A7J6DM91_CANSA|nr:hypothetical protein G4B88_027487 [Cannabis sativa]
MVVDECDSTAGCDADHDYQPPCPNNIVDASKAVWKALGVSKGDWGELDIYCLKYEEVEKSTMETLKFKHEYLMSQQRSHGGYNMSTNYGPLGDVVSAVMKQKQDGRVEGDFDAYSLGTSI